MKLLSMFAAMVLFSSISEAQVISDYHKNTNLKYQANTKDGRLDGVFTSWHSNGQKKAEGEFNNNQRVGTWKVWSPAGILKGHRVYQNNFQFEALACQSEPQTSVLRANFLRYELTKNEAGFIPYPKTEADNIYWEKKIWRKVEKNQTNAPLFKEENKKRLFEELASAKNISIYKADSDVFKDAFKAKGRKQLLNQEKVELVGYAIKEIQFFDLTRNLTESRILGICPIVKINGEEEKALCWLKYEDVRPFLAKQKVTVAYNSMVETVEDWLHFRHFQSLIEKESNVYNRTIADYTTEETIKKEQERIEMRLIDGEHDLWMFDAVK
jgi:gliding motility associated protien GldN